MTTNPEALATEHRAAAERAERATLWDEAVREYEACLSIVSDEEDGAMQDEAALLTALGRCYWNLSEARTSWRTLRRAIALYRERGDAIGLARATVEILRIWGPPDRQRDMADEALAALGDADAYLRARLLLHTRWSTADGEERFEQAMAIAEQHGFEDILTARTEREGWEAMHAGRIDDSIALTLKGHETYARLGHHDAASGMLRGAGFGTMTHGDLARGEALARQCVEYARSVHMRFTEQLALMDLAGVAYAHADFAQCNAWLDQQPTDTDFRADLYRMWMAELRGDRNEALALMVNPERGGGASTAISQTHGAAAGVLYRSGKEDAARQELQAWAEIARRDESICEEAPALYECIVALGGDELLRDVYMAFAVGTPRAPVAPLYATLQGRATAPTRGAVCVRLNKLDEAEQLFREGIAWCERERCPVDQGLCHAGLADVFDRRGNAVAAQMHVGAARKLFERHGAKLYLERTTERV